MIVENSKFAERPIRIVLVGTSHPGNVGAVARAMKTMCLSQLVLVRPRQFPHADATAMASGADDVLMNARLCDSLEDAVADCSLCFGASARLRSLPWPLESPRAAARKILNESASHPVALVFGRERSGLTNDELALCHALVHIPANPDYSSLNLAMAVQILCYELLMLSRDSVAATTMTQPAEAPANAEQMNYFYQHLQKVMISTEFLDPDAPRHLMRRIRRIFGRARPDQTELNILRGILSAVEKHGNKSE
ncbi:MAG: tRNA (cytosine(32)/uridine(32)-2'-O)-methyltransferase TrmJ [Gammaproteobacteria bacterium]|nr:tRNA (cytosine(32)/uridine(32)-2'-O)-methyltransferase TrmJ [Gammaproteobacteria bacterium]